VAEIGILDDISAYQIPLGAPAVLTIYTELAAAQTRPSRGECAANHPNDKPMAALTSAILRIVYLIQETFGSNKFCRHRLTDNV
jgi:hypothetical protein